MSFVCLFAAKPGIAKVRGVSCTRRGDCGKCSQSAATNENFVGVFYAEAAVAVYFETARAWMPLAAITHEQIQQCPGGLSAITACIVEDWLDQNLVSDFVVADGVPPMSLAIAGFISDMESQRGAFVAKGSAALKPCIHCGNCLMKGAQGAEVSENFSTIEEHDLALFPWGS